MENLVNITMANSNFWYKKKVLVTGHTGFKGAWAAYWLACKGAHITGLALQPDPGPNLFDLLGQDHLQASNLVDLRDMPKVQAVVREAQPDLVLHMAAQTLSWRPSLSSAQTVQMTADWYAAFLSGMSLSAMTVAQIYQYEDLQK